MLTKYNIIVNQYKAVNLVSALSLVWNMENLQKKKIKIIVRLLSHFYMKERASVELLLKLTYLRYNTVLLTPGNAEPLNFPGFIFFLLIMFHNISCTRLAVFKILPLEHLRNVIT